MLVPKLVTTLRGYTRGQFLADAGAGVVVGIVALPLAIAFGIASGVTPERGLFTAIVAGFIISALGGSRVQIGGPTGAFVVIVYDIVQQHGVEGLAVATIMAGLMLIGLGLARLGGAIKYIPHPVTTGFTSGIALIILVSQISDALGLGLTDLPADFVPKIGALVAGVSQIHWPSVAITVVTVAMIGWWPRVSRRIPGPFVALLLVTAAVQLFNLPVETIGQRFGAVPSSLPRPVLPSLPFAEWSGLVAPAFTIALLAAIESLLSAVVADGMIGSRHRSNMELVAQGVANIASPIFGGIPATGAIARTATNVRSGGRTPVAGIIHALTLMVILLVAGRWAALIPMPALAGILVVVAYHMSEWRGFRNELRGPRSDVLVLLATFLLTVLADLTVAVQVGMVLAAFLFMRRMAEVTDIRAVREGMGDDGPDGLLFQQREGGIPKGVQVYAVDGPFFFGAADRFREALEQTTETPKVLILVLRRVPTIDSTALQALRHVIRRMKQQGTRILVVGARRQPLDAMRRAGLLDDIGEANVLPNIDVALERARDTLGVVPDAG
ncbi:MAG TPA: SulP family inorganic anion transporter [Gemmatimonadales bacterium]|nr:SulP family inorganic anion transporter [Gemmatimonadales bacterium]